MSEEKDNKIIQLLEEQLSWLRLMGVSQLKIVLHENLKADEEKLLYEMSDGKSARDLEKITPLKRTRILRLWKQWKNAGLMQESKTYEGRMERSFSLIELGYDVKGFRSDTEENPQEEKNDPTE